MKLWTIHCFAGKLILFAAEVPYKLQAIDGHTNSVSNVYLGEGGLRDLKTAVTEALMDYDS